MDRSEMYGKIYKFRQKAAIHRLLYMRDTYIADEFDDAADTIEKLILENTRLQKQVNSLSISTYKWNHKTSI